MEKLKIRNESYIVVNELRLVIGKKVAVRDRIYHITNARTEKTRHYGYFVKNTFHGYPSISSAASR
jgi:hypothetical protein